MQRDWVYDEFDFFGKESAPERRLHKHLDFPISAAHVENLYTVYDSTMRRNPKKF